MADETGSLSSTCCPRQKKKKKVQCTNAQHQRDRTLPITIPLACEIRANQRLPLRFTPRNDELPYARDEEFAPPLPAAWPPSPPPLPRDDEERAEDEDRDIDPPLAAQLLVRAAEDCVTGPHNRNKKDGGGERERRCRGD